MVEVAIAPVVLGALATCTGWPGLERCALVAPLLPYLLLDLAAADRPRAFAHLLAWCTGVAMLGFAFGLGGGVPTLLGSDAGWLLEDTVRYVRQGEGLLARPDDFTTDHALDYAAVSLGSALGGGIGPLLSGARHILWMSWTWGALVYTAHASPHAVVLGVPPWTVVGALGYAVLLIGWGEITGAFLSRRRIAWHPLGRWIAAGTGLLGLHLLLRVVLAAPWAALLARGL